jgi:hypothetical protein
MESVISDNEDYRDYIVEVIGTPFGLQDVVMNEEEFQDFKLALQSIRSSYNRPVFFYQEIHPDPNRLIVELLEKGKELREEHALRLERAKRDEAKKQAAAKKRKEKREREKYERMKARFEGEK